MFIVQVVSFFQYEITFVCTATEPALKIELANYFIYFLQCYLFLGP